MRGVHCPSTMGLMASTTCIYIRVTLDSINHYCPLAESIIEIYTHKVALQKQNTFSTAATLIFHKTNKNYRSFNKMSNLSA